MTDHFPVVTKMVPGPELDRTIAEKVMGWNLEKSITGSFERWDKNDGNGGVWHPVISDVHRRGNDWFAPSTNIAHAWEVVMFLARSRREPHPAAWWNLTAGGFVCINVDDEFPKSLARIIYDSPEKMPLAICIAALHAVGLEIIS